jgi:cytochrome c-type biogenesis protein CcmH
MNGLRIAAAALLLSWALPAPAQIEVNQEPLVFENAEQEARFQQLTEELRCLVCQNQNLADSDAPLAHDLREEIHDMMLAGQDNEQIKAFLVDRYGDFVLYNPPVKSNTIFLWAAPLVLLVFGAVVVMLIVRRQGRLAAPAEGTDE